MDAIEYFKLAASQVAIYLTRHLPRPSPRGWPRPAPAAREARLLGTRMRVGGHAAFRGCAVVAGGEFGVVVVAAGGDARGVARPLGQPAGPGCRRSPHGAARPRLGPHPRRAGAAGESAELLSLVMVAPPSPFSRSRRAEPPLVPCPGGRVC